MKLKVLASFLAIILFTSATAIFFSPTQADAKADISVAMKAKKKMTLLAIKNSSDIPLYSFELKSIDGSIKFVKTKQWDRQKMDQSTVVLRTDDKPMTRGSNMIVMIILDRQVSALEWQAFGFTEISTVPALMNRGTITISTQDSVKKEEIEPTPKKEEPKPIISCSGVAACFTAIVTKIVDGDTLDVTTDNNTVRIRLALTNTPERGEPLYNEATKFTATLCSVGSSVVIDEDDGQREGSFDRMIAKVFCGDKVLNAELLYSSLAVIDTRFCSKSEFASENWAQQYGCGKTVKKEEQPAPMPSPTPVSGKNLSVDINVQYPVITRGSTQIIRVNVYADGSVVSNASVSALVTYASVSTTKSFQGMTDGGGTYTFSWQIGGNSSLGTFTVKVTAMKDGYTAGNASTTFQVTKKS